MGEFRDDYGLGRLVEKSRQLTTFNENETFYLHRSLDQIDQLSLSLAQRQTRSLDANALNRAYDFGLK